MKTIQDYIDQHTPLYTQNEVNMLLSMLKKCANAMNDTTYVTEDEVREWIKSFPVKNKG